ncbi:MAG: nuclear transport factor 2 family protein [Chitinophagaceae bacterium]|nr:nuclear transport factor 2 family protein [Chitinophagaceae bacterium]
MKKILSVILVSAFLVACNNEKKDETAAAAPEVKSDKAQAPVELIMDSNFVNGTKATMAAFQNKDIEGYTADMADNIIFRWSGGDSLVGKQAVKDYYTGRFNIIDNIKFSNPIFLPVMANVSPNGGATASGKWMLDWYMVNVKYKNGKAIGFWVHNTMHYNAAGKIDQATQFIDRHPIMEATKDLVKK